MSVAVTLLLICFIGLLSYLLLRLLRARKVGATDYEYLSLLPENNASFDLRMSRAIITKIADAITPSSPIIKFLNICPRLSLRIDASKQDGARLTLVVAKKYSRLASDIILSSTHKIQVQKLAPSDLDSEGPKIESHLRLQSHYSLPYISEYTKEDNDRLESVIGSIDSLTSDDSFCLELSVTKSSPNNSLRLKNRLLSGETPVLFPSNTSGRFLSALWTLVSFVVSILRTLLYLIELATLGSAKVIKTERKPPILVTKEKVVQQLDKLYDELFKSTITLTVSSSDQIRLKQLNNQFISAVTSAGKSMYQGLIKARHPAATLLSATELANFFHLPEDDQLRHLYSKSSYKQLPPPNASIKKTNQDILLGTNSYKGLLSNIYLTSEDRQKHLLITGTTGSGKSSLMANNILKDIRLGRGVSVIDPHGDLADELMANIPESRAKDVIYFNPIDLRHPIGLNPLEIKSDKDSLQYRIEAEQLTESLISLFRKVFSEGDSGGHRIEYLLRNTIHTALNVNNCTIFTIYRILNDSDFRQKVIANLTDQNLKNFWQQEIGKTGDYQRIKMSAGVTSKLGRFLFSEPVKRVFGQVDSTIDFENIINSKKILICNFSKGLIGEDGSKLFSTSVLTMLQLASLSSAKKAYKYRGDHYLYVDEFHNFSTESFIQMLAESRKYRLFLTISEQSLSSQDERELSLVLANIGNLISFRTSSPKDENILLNFYSPHLERGDLLNLPLHFFYIKTSRAQSDPPTSCKGIGPLMEESRLKAKDIIARSRKGYGFKPLKA